MLVVPALAGRGACEQAEACTTNHNGFMISTFISSEANLPHAIVEIFRAADNPDFDAHEIDRQIAPIDLRKADRVFLGGDDRGRLPLFAAIDRVQHFLLCETVVISETL